MSPRPAARRSRSASYDSASSISRSPSLGPGRKASRSPVRSSSRTRRDNSLPTRRERPRAVDFNHTDRRTRSRSPDEYARPTSRRVPSPRRDDRHSTRSRRGSTVSSRGNDGRDRRSARRSYSRSLSRSPRRKSRSRSPPSHSGRGYRERDDDRTTNRGSRQPAPEVTRAAQPPPAPRERSLSPFSRRLALTQSMNTGR